jgi:hypothetical protein
MSNPIPFGEAGLLAIGGLSMPPNPVALPLGGGSATIDNYAVAYIAPFHPDNNSQYYLNVVPKAGGVPAGGVITVTVTVNATSQDGTALPSQAVSFDVSGPALPPQAASISATVLSARTQFLSSTTDPGSGTVTLA